MSAPSNKKPARDRRPKVISFGTSVNGLNIAARQNILWPCNAIKISIPQKKKSALNVFEETVLKITEIESGDTKKIAQLTCMEKELVAFIQNRLNQLDLLNNRYALSDEGKKLLESWRNKDEASAEYTAGTVFMDILSGKLLPYIHIGSLKHETITSIDDDFITVEIGSTGKSTPQRCRLIRPSQNSYWKTVPDTNDIIRAIREFKKKHKRHALLNQGVDHYPPPVPMAEAISLHENPELVYLHCNALIQIGNSDLLVTDGFGLGFSESFANYLTSQNFGWLTNLKQQGVVEKINGFETFDDRPARKSYKYAEISSRIAGSKSALRKIRDLEINSSYYESDYRQETEKGIKNLYAALEWSLCQVVAENPVSKWEQSFSSRNFRDNEKLLVGFAKKVGFVVNENNQSLLQVKPGAIRQVENGKAELQPLLALAISGASSNASHPIHHLAQNHSGFLNHALRLKKYRDPIEHGSAEKLNIDDKILEELIEATVPMIISLVPGVAGDLGEAEKFASNGDVNQERLKASIELDKAFGTVFVSHLRGDIKEQLIRSELMLAQFSDDKKIEIIKCFASVMQHALFDAVSDRRVEIESDSIRKIAVEKIVQAGFFSAKEQVPVQLTTVAPNKARRAVQGVSPSLGAQLLALFLLGSENELNQLKDLEPEFVKIVADLAFLRGHGNDNRHLTSFSRNDLESLKNNVFKAIKIITEVF